MIGMPVGQQYLGYAQLVFVKIVDQSGEPDWTSLPTWFSCLVSKYEKPGCSKSLTCPVSIKIRFWPLPTRYVLVPCSCMLPGFPPSIRTTSVLSSATAGRYGSPAFREDRYSCHPDCFHTFGVDMFLSDRL